MVIVEPLSYRRSHHTRLRPGRPATVQVRIAASSGPAIETCTFGVADLSEKLRSAPYGGFSPCTWASGSLSRPSAVARKRYAGRGANRWKSSDCDVSHVLSAVTSSRI